MYWLDDKLKHKNSYHLPGLEPGPLAFRANALTLSYPGQVRIHDRAHSPTFPSLHLRHNSFSNPSVALPTSQLNLQPFRCFTYVTAHSLIFLSFLLRHRLFTYVVLRAAYGNYRVKMFINYTLFAFFQKYLLSLKQICYISVA